MSSDEEASELRRRLRESEKRLDAAEAQVAEYRKGWDDAERRLSLIRGGLLALAQNGTGSDPLDAALQILLKETA